MTEFGNEAGSPASERLPPAPPADPEMIADAPGAGQLVQAGPSVPTSSRAVRSIAPTAAPDVEETTEGRPTESPPGSAGSAGAARRSRSDLISAAAPWIGLLVGSLLVTESYSWAATHSTGTQQFTFFWLGVFAFVVPAVHRLMRTTVRADERLVLTITTALFFYLPKVLRSPTGPIFADELAHWRQADLVGTTGRLFQPNPFISVVDSYPGLHALTDALQRTSGLSTWGVGVFLIAIFLSLNVVGVYYVVDLLVASNSSRVAAIAAMVYACSSGFMFFDSQYAYESMGLPLLIWTLVAVAHLQEATLDRRRQLAWVSIACIFSTALVLTHHLTSFVLFGILALTAFIAVIQRRRGTLDRRTFRLTAFVSLYTMAATLFWTFVIAPSVRRYLSPFLTEGVSQLSGILQQHESPRPLFALSTIPSYEHYAGFLAPAIAAPLALLGLLHLPRLRRLSPLALSLVALGLAYFPSVPFILTTSGSQGARRSWDFSYIGVGLLVAIAFDAVLTSDRLGRARRAKPWALAAMIAVLLLGNVAVGQNVEYRFPGPYVYGSDTRSLTAEERHAVRWFDATQGTNRRIVADRQDGIAFGSLGLNWIERAWAGLPLWQFFFQVERPDRGVFLGLQSLHTQYLVVDRRTSEFLPRTGVYVVGDEPGARVHLTPPPAAALTKYDLTPWTNVLFSSDNYGVMRFDLAALGLCTDQTPEPGADVRRCLSP